MLSVLLFTDSDYPFGIFWPLCCLFFYLRILITSLVSFGHCVVCSSIYRFWLPLWYLLATVLSVLLFTDSDYPIWYLRFTDSDYPFGIFWPLCCLFFYLQILITPLVSFGHCVVCSSSIYGFWLPLWYLRFTDSDYPFGIFWPLCCLFFYLQILITPLVSFGNCVVCSSSIYRFWLPLWYLRFTDSDYPFGIFWPLCCLFFYLQILITPLVSFGHCVVWSSIYRFWLPPFGIFKLFMITHILYRYVFFYSMWIMYPMQKKQFSGLFSIILTLLWKANLCWNDWKKNKDK